LLCRLWIAPWKSAAVRHHRFDRFVADTGRRLLLRDGVVVPLTSTALDLLLALVDGRRFAVSSVDEVRDVVLIRGFR
jgi:DNA-binding winged helix-turn-helix (wHTH) protein